MSAGSGIATTEFGASLASITTSSGASGHCTTVFATRLQAVSAAAALSTGGSGTATTEFSATLTVTSPAVPGGGGGGGSDPTPFTIARGPFKGDGPTCSFVGEGL